MMTPSADAAESVDRPGTVLVVDDIEQNITLVRRVLARDGHRVMAASNGYQALDVIGSELPDLVLLDVMMPGLSGFDLCRRLKEDDATRLTPVVLVTGLKGKEERLRGIDAGADDFLGKPVDASELRARVRSLIRIKRYTDDLESTESLLMGLATTVEARDAYTRGHCERLARYAVAMGQVLGLPPEDQRALRQGGYLHDLGKIAVPDAILLKPGPLTPEEFELLKRHTVVGDELCAGFRSLRRVRTIVRHHHERLNGRGYPDKLRGAEVPVLAQIIAVVDVYDALRTARPYKAARGRREAFDALRDEVRRGMHDGELVSALEGLTAKEPVEVTVALPSNAPSR